MRRTVLLLALVASLVGAESAHALSCVPGPPPLARYAGADAAVAARLVAAQPLLPEEREPGPGEPRIGGWSPSGPFVVLRYRVERVFKGDGMGPRMGDLFSVWGRVGRGDWLATWPKRSAWMLKRANGSLDGPFVWGPCSSRQLTIAEARRGALLHRYAEAGGAASSTCVPGGATCASIKRDGDEAILRFATSTRKGDSWRSTLWGAEKSYEICVRAPDGSRTCRRFTAQTESSGLIALRVRWSRHFPDRGRGAYDVRWLPPEFRSSGYSIRKYGRHLPLLRFRR
jgi:hypothetical protein